LPEERNTQPVGLVIGMAPPRLTRLGLPCGDALPESPD